MKTKHNVYGYGSHLTFLTHAFMCTEGPVLECGGGLCSTPVLHSLALRTEPQRLVVTGEEQCVWARYLQGFSKDWHIIRHVTNWETFLKNMNTDWGLAFVDNGVPTDGNPPGLYNCRFEIMKLLPESAVWVVHDTNDPRIGDDPWWKARVAQSPWVYRHMVNGIETTMLSQRELPKSGV